ncbi:helix-turn-helix domain-containing protein [Pediococcus pentosaceus]|uniref:helix-turn-helix domain-containing protein n=1 Tax=Pediococcus pentosaceus TaxID=1255 RepID=UPI002016D68B|nr:helix-turn-helix transcriptional regulator [Pediococcus pentosaceus]MCL3858663.1 helix-turn-helix domain-containing protein [Pediococcus pentosaceus]
MIVFERIKELAKKQGKSINDVEKDLGYSRNTLYRLKRSNPSAKTLKEIADHFKVTTDYLLGLSDEPSPDNNPDLIAGLFRKVTAEYDLNQEEKEELKDDFTDYLSLRARRLEERRKRRGK